MVQKPREGRYTKESRKEWKQIQEECLWEDRGEWERICHKIYSIQKRVGKSGQIYKRSAYGRIEKNGVEFVIR
jgi:hypothetical protein